MRRSLGLLIVVAALGAASCNSTPPALTPPAQPPFPDGWNVIDLTRPLDHHAPYLAHPEAFPFERVPLSPGMAGRRTSAYSLLGHMGTHVSAPATFESAGATIERIAAGRLIAELVIINAPDLVKDGGATGLAVGEARVLAHEARYGRIPDGALVVLRTGIGAISSRDLDLAGKQPEPGYTFHGWSEQAVRFLATQRNVRGVGTDAPALDSGPNVATAPAAKSAARAGAFGLVGLANLSSIPRRGAYVAIGVLPVTGAGAAQARVLGLIPPRPGGPTRSSDDRTRSAGAPR